MTARGAGTSSHHDHHPGSTGRRALTAREAGARPVKAPGRGGGVITVIAVDDRTVPRRQLS